ncbi:potassium-transporting ATPase subunit C [Rhodococcus aerolatus]
MRTTTTLLRQTATGLRLLLVLTVLLGGAYPLAVWGVSRISTSSAEGSPLVDASGCVVGSALLGVDPQVAPGDPDPFFHTRYGTDPTAAYPALAPGNPSASAASNLGPGSETLAEQVTARRAAVAAREDVDPGAVPPDAVTASGSGLDPQISPAYAALQVARVARVTGRSPADVAALVAAHTQGRQLGFLGAERVDVPALNTALGLTAPACATPAG